MLLKARSGLPNSEFSIIHAQSNLFGIHYQIYVFDNVNILRHSLFDSLKRYLHTTIVVTRQALFSTPNYHFFLYYQNLRLPLFLLDLGPGHTTVFLTRVLA